jgi:hypothetical protein
MSLDEVISYLKNLKAHSITHATFETNTLLDALQAHVSNDTTQGSTTSPGSNYVDGGEFGGE